MQRIYLPKTKFSDNLILLEEGIYHQLTRVLRSRVGDMFTFFDGKDLIDHLYEITDINSREVTLMKKETIEKSSENSPAINLYQARPNKLSKIEYILQKGVESGISNFCVYPTERSQELRISDSKQQRLEKIIKEAVEQSNRNLIPQLHMSDEIDLEDISGQNFYLHTSEEKNSLKLRNLNLDKKDSVNIWVGPEGGFTESEVESFDGLDFTKLYLGDRVLRTETAGLVVGFFISQL